MQESRNIIKARMLKTIASLWGYPETQAENNFDPLVSMLLASCATELEKISGEIHASRARVLERLVQLLTPDVLTTALPAHAIASAMPLDDHAVLSRDAQLYTDRKLSQHTENTDPLSREIFFSPTGPARLNRAAVRFMAAGNHLYQMLPSLNKELIMKSHAGKELPPSTLWLAIDHPDVDLDNSQFYFDCRNEADQNLFFHQLPKACWLLGNHQLKSVAGYSESKMSGGQLDIAEILNRDNNVNGKVEKQVNEYYKKYFITVADKNHITKIKDQSPSLPPIVADTFGHTETRFLSNEPMRWIAIRFPETINNRLLQDVVCIMNCFPVINRRCHEINNRLQEIINIIPLQTEDLFLDLESVSDDDGKLLNIHSLKNGAHGELNLLMRNGGVGRFDERDAASITEYILQLLRDDSAAFSILGKDFMNTEMKQLQQVINKLEQRLSSCKTHPESVPYLVIRNSSKNHGSNLFIRYYSTNGSQANNIKTGTGLQLYKGGALKSNQAILVTTTRGGRNKLNAAETVLAYKYALLSRDRLITAEDIKTFCHYQLGEQVRNIQVQKGVTIHPDQKEGFKKTVDVLISIEKKRFAEMKDNAELSFWQNTLQQSLEGKSASLLPFRIYLKEAS
jgi:hypothetical protein